MIVLDVIQGSPKWHQARLGIPTASRFNEVLTNKTMKPAKGAAYLRDLLTEWALGEPLESGSSGWIERGHELEEQGRIAYEYEEGRKVETVGFITTNTGQIGCSPDGLVGEDGGLELKFPSAAKHVGYMLDPDSFVAEYRHQVQGSLWVTDRKWWDIRSGHAGDDPLPPVVARCLPDAEWQDAFAQALPSFLARLEAGKARLRVLGIDR